MAHADAESADDGPIEVECRNCGYVWEYGGALPQATCPACQRKTPTRDDRHPDGES